MSDLSKEQVKEAYAKAIEVLFGGVVQASPNEITEQVIQDVDKMISEIANCSQILPRLVLISSTKQPLGVL